MIDMGHSDQLDRLIAHKRALDARESESPRQAQRLHELRAWQTARLAKAYADLRSEPRYTGALEFFLSDLYGPQDFVRRDDELRRALSRLKRAMPATLLEVLGKAIELQVLTSELDQNMVIHLKGASVSDASYATAYRAVGRLDDRKRQIDLIIRIGEDLARIVGQSWMGLALRAAHIPAHAAGFGVLQSFLERGFRAFRHIGDAQPLLRTIQEREADWMESLLRGDTALPANLTREPAANG
jgi:hypothetical protein